MPTRKFVPGTVYDLICVGLIVALGVYLWPTWSISASADMPTAPWWGTVRDALLDGPDAGEWARSIVALNEGRFSDVDVHRAPTWMVLVNIVMAIEDNVVFAGHMTNHILMVVAGLTVWLIGRLSTGRSLGLAAAALTMVNSHSTEAASRFGVDMAVIALIPLTILSAQLACRKGYLGLLAGAVAGAVMATHLSTLPYALPALLLIVLAGSPGRRRIAIPMYFLGLGVALAAWQHFFVVGTFEDLQVSFANGIAPGYQGDGMVSSWAAAIAIIQAGAAEAMSDAMLQLMLQIRPHWLPMGSAVALFWIGVLGPGLREISPDTTGHSRVQVWRTFDWKIGLTLLACLAPLPLLAAAQAPERYGDNLAPVAAILLVRGGFSVGALALRTLGYFRGGGVQFKGAVFAALGIGIFSGELHHSGIFIKPQHPTTVELGRWALGQSLKEHFPPNTGIAIVAREPIIAGHHERCPAHVCPEDTTESAFAQCLHMMNLDCFGDGPLAYVGLESELQDPNAPARGAMDQWVAKRWSPIDQVEMPGFTASIFAIPRAEIPETELPEYLTGPPEVHGGSPEGAHFVAEPTLDSPLKDRAPEDRGPSGYAPTDSSSLERPAPNKPPSGLRPLPDLWGEAPKGNRSGPPLGPDGIPLPGSRPPPLGPDGTPLPAQNVEPDED
jgi:hypothetical protein